MPRVLIAPDKFKGSLSAAEVAAHVAAGLSRAVPGLDVDELPVADGGEGTVAAALAAGYEHVRLRATGPLGTVLDTGYARQGTTAVIEMAAVSGIEMLEPSGASAREATSRGVGELIGHALDEGAQTLVVAVGGSASTDGGAGMLAALGAELHGPSGALPDGGAALGNLERVDLTALHPRLAGSRIVLASDVDNPLLGETGAAAVYGPQKGADPSIVTELDEALARWVAALTTAGRAAAEELSRAPGAGAAGGVGYACLLLGAERRAGIAEVLELTGFDDRVRGADLVITGEGSLDAQSLQGKTPVGVAQAAARQGITTVAVCGRSTLTPQQQQAAGLAGVYTLADVEPDPEVSMREAGRLLEEIASRVAAAHLTATS